MKDNVTDSLSERLEDNLQRLRMLLGLTSDLSCVSTEICGTVCAVITIEGMVSSEMLNELVMRPLSEIKKNDKTGPAEVMKYLTEVSLLSADRSAVYTLSSIADKLFSGYAVILADGICKGAAFGIQGYITRAVSSPATENDLLASQEAFSEVVRTNISLVRRRLKSPLLRFEMMKSGRISKTDICLVFIDGKADEKTLSQERRRIREIELDSILGPGFIQPFLEKRSDDLLFSEIGYTERPDMLCANLIQGRIGVLVDGAPFALICPYLFSQNFENIDDYAAKTYFASFVKIIRIFSFILAVAFPGIYVAAVNFSPEMLNFKLLLSLAAGERSTMLSLFSELVIVMILLEILREASLRLPNSIGTAISIAGGLIIGDTAVTSGLISSPLLIVVGLTATASFVLPAFAQQISVLRLMFIFAGGFAGFFGIAICAVLISANICSQSFVGIPFTSPASPLHSDKLITVFGRKNFKGMAEENTTIKDLA